MLFLCSRNRLRSPTAEEVFAGRPGIEVASAGLAPDVAEVVTVEHIEWAEMIFVMERAHKTKLTRPFGASLKDKRVKKAGPLSQARLHV
ncbi:cellular communication/signal transduction [Candidatus Paraburkholderia calva]|nr:cellular communication/signal transduction [Candidatus Paraburkholderia calva]